MKTKKAPDDGMEWLRNLRRKIAVECGYDLATQSDVYRAAAAKQRHRSYREGHVDLTTKKRVRVAT